MTQFKNEFLKAYWNLKYSAYNKSVEAIRPRQKRNISSSKGISLASCSPAELASVFAFNTQCKPILGLQKYCKPI